MDSLKRGRRDADSGWYLDVFPITPQRLLGGEMPLAIGGIFLAGMLVFFVASRVSGTIFGVPAMIAVVLVGVAFFFTWCALIRVMWKIDPWLSKTFMRFMRHPNYIPAHSTGAVSPIVRLLEKLDFYEAPNTYGIRR